MVNVAVADFPFFDPIDRYYAVSQLLVVGLKGWTMSSGTQARPNIISNQMHVAHSVQLCLRCDGISNACKRIRVEMIMII